MQRWEYKVMTFGRDEQYTAALNELGREGWELLSVASELVETPSPKKGSAFPMPRAIGRLEDAADKITKLGTSDTAADVPAGPTTRLLWVFRRPRDDDRDT